MRNCFSQEKVADEAKHKKSAENKLKEFMEIIEKSAEKTKRKELSPNAIKPNCGQSPEPRIKLFSPCFESGNQAKRKVEDTEKIKKKVKKINYVEFFDPRKGIVEKFPCFPDQEFFKKGEVREKVTVGGYDDDCDTNTEVKELSREYCITQIIKALVEVECKRSSA